MLSKLAAYELSEANELLIKPSESFFTVGLTVMYFDLFNLNLLVSVFYINY